MNEEVRPDPKFNVGQVVVICSQPGHPFKIIDLKYVEGTWAYAWNRRNYASENMLRALTPDEVGVSVVAEQAICDIRHNALFEVADSLEAIALTGYHPEFRKGVGRAIQHIRGFDDSADKQSQS